MTRLWCYRTAPPPPPDAQWLSPSFSRLLLIKRSPGLTWLRRYPYSIHRIHKGYTLAGILELHCLDWHWHLQSPENTRKTSFLLTGGGRSGLSRGRFSLLYWSSSSISVSLSRSCLSIDSAVLRSLLSKSFFEHINHLWFEYESSLIHIIHSIVTTVCMQSHTYFGAHTCLPTDLYHAKPTLSAK